MSYSFDFKTNEQKQKYYEDHKTDYLEKVESSVSTKTPLFIFMSYKKWCIILNFFSKVLWCFILFVI